MKLISCIIRPDRLAPVKEALFRAVIVAPRIFAGAGEQKRA